MKNLPQTLSEMERISLEEIQENTSKFFQRIDRGNIGFVIAADGQEKWVLLPASWYDSLMEYDLGKEMMAQAKNIFDMEWAPNHTIELALQFSYQLTLAELNKAMEYFGTNLKKRPDHPYLHEWMRFMARLRHRQQIRQRVYDSRYAIEGVLPGEDYTAYCFCRDGKIRMFDLKPIIERGGVNSQLKDEKFFRERMCVMGETLAWDIAGDMDMYECIDVDPSSIYDDGVVVDATEVNIWGETEGR